MAPVKQHSALSQTSLRHIMLIGLTVALIGVAYIQRGPDLSVLPVMAERPVILPDGAALYVQKYEVSVAEWNACHAAGGCLLALRSTAAKSATTTPATGLSFVDVGEYLVWINGVTHHEFRLPSRLEWEHMAAEVLPHDPNPIFNSPDLTWASSYLTAPQTKRSLRAQGTFATTSEGIVDLNGSVWEWTGEYYAGASKSDISPDRCPAFFVGGEHVAAMSFLIRDPARGGCAVGSLSAHLGMRLVSDENP